MRRVGLALASVALIAAQPVMGDEFDGLPEGNGRDEVVGACTACHSAAVIRQQRLSRATWDETLNWMEREQKMPALDAATRIVILDYLEANFGPKPGEIRP